MSKNKNLYKKPDKNPDKNLDKNLSLIINDTRHMASQWSQEYGSVGHTKGMSLQLAHGSGFFFGGLDQFTPDCYIGMPQNAEGHIIVVGSSGSGKSTGIVKPTLMTWGGTICATDIKGELSEYYKTFSDELLRVGILTRPYIIFDPTQVDGPAYDPFWWLLQDQEANLVSNIDEIVRTIIPSLPDGKSQEAPFWRRAERDLLSAALLHYFALGLGFSEAICKILDTSLSSLCEELAKSENACVRMRVGQLADADHTDPKMLGSIDRGLRNEISLFATDPYISHAFRGKREGAVCFNWDDLNQNHIFFRIPAYRIETWGKAINLMYAQLISYLKRRPEKYSKQGHKNTQILLLMDEFAQFDKLPMVTKCMSTLRSKNVNMCLVVQSVAQLDMVYGEKERRALFDNAQYVTVLQANDADTQKWFAERIGTQVHYQPGIGKQLDEYMYTAGYSIQVSEIREWSVFPHELSTLTDALLLSPSGFCRLEKLRPQENIQQRLLSSMHRLHRTSQKEVHASIDDPIDLNMFGEVARTNEDASMLSINERTANANRRVEEAQHQMLPVMEDKLTAEDEDDSCFGHAVDNLLFQQFPEILDLKPGFMRGETDWSKPLEKILLELTEDQRRVENMKRKANWPIPGESNV